MYEYYYEGHCAGDTHLPFGWRNVLLMQTHAITASGVQPRNGLSNSSLFSQVGMPQLDEIPIFSSSLSPLHCNTNKQELLLENLKLNKKI